jgi:hypothetical protein
MERFVLPADQVGAEHPVTLPPLPGVFVPGEPVELTDEQVEIVREHGLPLVPVAKPKARKPAGGDG